VVSPLTGYVPLEVKSDHAIAYHSSQFHLKGKWFVSNEAAMMQHIFSGLPSGRIVDPALSLAEFGDTTTAQVATKQLPIPERFCLHGGT